MADAENAQHSFDKKVVDIKTKYASIDNLQRSEKVHVLSDLKTNPHFLSDPKDSLANSFMRWKTLSTAPGAAKYTPEQRAEAASNFYDKELAPFYKSLPTGSSILPKDTWLRSAWGAAQYYDINERYNVSTLGRLTDTGLARGYAGMARAAEFATNFLGMAVKTGHDLLRGAAMSAMTVDPTLAPGLYNKMTQWHNQLAHMQAEDTTKYAEASKEGYGATARAVTKDIPILGAMQKWEQKTASNFDFWGDINPVHGFWENAVSQTAEVISQAPLFEALGSASGETVSAARGVPFIGNLTKALQSSKVGRAVIPLLTAGAEGIEYGELTKKQDDKDAALQNAITFMAGHTVFAGGSWLLGKGFGSLGEVLKARGGPEAEAYESKMNVAKMSVEKGERPATAEEKYVAHKEQVANNIAGVSLAGHKVIVQAAINHVLQQEGDNLSKDEIRAMHAEMMVDDPAANKPMLGMVSYIRSIIGEKRLGELEPKEMKALQGKLARLQVDASHELVTHVPEIQAKVESDAAKLAETNPEAKASIQRKAARLQKEAEALGQGGRYKPEDYQKAATKWFKDAQVKAAQKAEAELGNPPASQAINASKKAATKGAANLEQAVTTSAARPSLAQPRLSASVKTNYISYFTKAYADKFGSKAPASQMSDAEFGKYLREFYGNSDDSNAEVFAHDLWEHFGPKELKDEGIYFEKDYSTEVGKDNPNVLAFMLNYRDYMPKALGDMIEERLIDSAKVQKSMNTKKPTEDQIWAYALGVYNHVSEFVGSTAYLRGTKGKGPERNIFRSSEPLNGAPTKWQLMQLNEVEAEDKKTLKAIFGRDKSGLQSALETYKGFAAKRRLEFSRAQRSVASEIRRNDASESIAQQVLEHGGSEYTQWKF